MDNYLGSALWSNAQPLKGNEQGVYLLFDREEIVYIGKSWNCFLRVAEHTRKDSGVIFTSWSFLPFDSSSEMEIVKRKLVDRFKPKYNV